MRDEISLLRAQLTYKKRLEVMLKELQSQQEHLQKKAEKLKKVMISEQKDVDRLEGRSMAKFFYFALGKIDEKLDEERREAYAARVKYDAAARELEAVEQDIEATEEDLADLADCEARYEQVMEEKRIAIEQAGTALSAELLEKEHTLSHLRGQERELEEAIAAGTAVLRTASEVLSSLRNVESLGYLDRFGKNPLTDMARNETLDDAQRNVELLQVGLQRFNKELTDICCRERMQGSIERMLQFSDSFFDNLFAEGTVPQKIRQAHAQVEHVLDPILGILRQLQTRLEEVRHHQVRAKADVDGLIASIEV